MQASFVPSRGVAQPTLGGTKVGENEHAANRVELVTRRYGGPEVKATSGASDNNLLPEYNYPLRLANAKMAGLGGLGTSEVSLRGVLTSEGAFVGILQGADSKNYIVRVGDRLSDGTIRSITRDSMVILQQVNDPLSLEKQREVRKLLRQTEEAK